MGKKLSNWILPEKIEMLVKISIYIYIDSITENKYILILYKNYISEIIYCFVFKNIVVVLNSALFFVLIGE